MSTTLGPFVKDNCKSRIGKSPLCRAKRPLVEWRMWKFSSALHSHVTVPNPQSFCSFLSSWVKYYYENTYCALPPPPAWWYWGDQTVPWLTPQQGSPASVCLYILLLESWWPHRSPSCWAASGGHCTLRQIHLRMKMWKQNRSVVIKERAHSTCHRLKNVCSHLTCVWLSFFP